MRSTVLFFLALAAAGCATSTTSSTDPSSGPSDDPPVAAAPACGPDIDFASDAKHCGACGHDCLGGACNAGACTPVVITSFEEGANLSAITVADERVWFMDTSDLWSIPVTGGTPTKIPVETAGYASTHIAVDDAFVYWTTPYEVWRMRRDDPAARPEVFVAPPSNKTSGILLVTGGDLYVYGGPEYGGALFRVDLATKKQTSWPLAPSMSWSWRSIAERGTNVAWTDNEAIVVLDTATGETRNIAIETAHTASRVGAPYELGIDAEAAYVLEMEESNDKLATVQRVPLDGSGDRTVLYDSRDSASALFVDDAKVYFEESPYDNVNGAVPRVMAIDKKTSTARGVTPLYEEEGGVGLVAMDATSLYLRTPTRLLRLRKPL